MSPYFDTIYLICTFIHFYFSQREQGSLFIRLSVIKLIIDVLCYINQSFSVPQSNRTIKHQKSKKNVLIIWPIPSKLCNTLSSLITWTEQLPYAIIMKEVHKLSLKTMKYSETKCLINNTMRIHNMHWNTESFWNHFFADLGFSVRERERKMFSHGSTSQVLRERHMYHIERGDRG
jgi:hypothetical protein